MNFFKAWLTISLCITIALATLGAILFLAGCFIRWEWLPLPAFDGNGLRALALVIGFFSFLVAPALDNE
jgi:hypothetical protein